MKKFVIVMVATFISAGAFAKTDDVRLKVDLRPIGRTLGGGGVHSGAILYSDGEAVFFQSSVEEPSQNKEVVVAQLSPEAMESIDAKIEASREGTQKEIVELCEAIPTQRFHYTADNGQVELLSGASPCGGKLKNEAPEAQALVNQLNRFLQARN